MEETRQSDFYQPGTCYFLRTVTHHYTGRCVRATPAEIVLVDAAWIADDGRFAAFLRSGVASEVEPYPDGQEVCINRASLIDGTVWDHPLPRSEK